MWTLILIITLVVSLFLNVVAFWYIKQTLEKLLFITDNIDFVDTSLKAFKANLDAVYEAERFYGDETLEALCQHANEAAADIELFSSIVEVFTEANIEEMEREEEMELEEADAQ